MDLGSGASGGYLYCFGKKDTKEADQRGTRAPARDAFPFGNPQALLFQCVETFHATNTAPKHFVFYR